MNVLINNPAHTKFYKSICVRHDEYYGKYCVFAYTSDGNIEILYQSYSHDKADDYADNFSINNNMYYDRSADCYYNKKYRVHY